MNSIKSGAGANGTFAMNTTGVKNINFVGIEIPTTVTITALKNKDGDTIALSDYILAPASAIPMGYITANNQDEYFTHITTSAGDCILNLKGE